MSDGMSDASAIGRLAQELEEATYKLRDAIKKTEEGHRGISVDIQSTINGVLARSPDCKWRITRMP